MVLRLNATRRSINFSVYLVFDLEAGRFKFLGENLLGDGAFTLDSFLERVVRVNAKPTKSLIKFAILSRKGFVTSEQFKWKA